MARPNRLAKTLSLVVPFTVAAILQTGLASKSSATPKSQTVTATERTNHALNRSYKGFRFFISQSFATELIKVVKGMQRKLEIEYHPDKKKHDPRHAAIINAHLDEVLARLDLISRGQAEAADEAVKEERKKQREAGEAPVTLDLSDIDADFDFGDEERLSPPQRIDRQLAKERARRKVDPDFAFDILERMKRDSALNDKVRDLIDFLVRAGVPLPEETYKLQASFRDPALKTEHVVLPVSLLQTDPNGDVADPVFYPHPQSTAQAALELDEQHPAYGELVSATGKFGKGGALFDFFGPATFEEIETGLRFAGRDSRGVVQLNYANENRYLVAFNPGAPQGRIAYRAENGWTYPSLNAAIDQQGWGDPEGTNFVMTQNALLYRLGFFPQGEIELQASQEAINNLNDFASTDPLRTIYQCFQGRCSLADASMDTIKAEMTARNVPAMGIVKDLYQIGKEVQSRYYTAVFTGKELHFYNRVGAQVNLEQAQPTSRRFGLLLRDYYEAREPEENHRRPMLPLIPRDRMAVPQNAPTAGNGTEP